MINLRYVDSLVNHEDQVVPCITACIPDGSINNLRSARWLLGVKTTDHNYIGMLVDH